MLRLLPEITEGKVPRPGLEPGTSRSKREMIVRFTTRVYLEPEVHSGVEPDLPPYQRGVLPETPEDPIAIQAVPPGLEPGLRPRQGRVQPLHQSTESASSGNEKSRKSRPSKVISSKDLRRIDFFD